MLEDLGSNNGTWVNGARIAGAQRDPPRRRDRDRERTGSASRAPTSQVLHDAGTERRMRLTIVDVPTAR
jgi:pSer/pThr/pTyr-binding forkhead associated (FHA) protein